IAVPTTEKDHGDTTVVDYQVSKIALSKTTFESDVMAKDSMNNVLKRLERYKSQISQLEEKNQLISYVQHLISPIESSFPVPGMMAIPDQEILKQSKDVITLGHTLMSWVSEIES
ncbi:hypothetical protein KI387_001345, partial [Taxus chinensis]